jgi:hypothetical protein
MSMDAIKAQIEAARTAAAQVPATVANDGGSTAVATTGAAQPGRAVSLGELLTQGGMQVKAFLKVDKSGFYIGQDSTTLVDEIDVEFTLSDVVPFFGIRYGKTPAKYLKSFDRMVDSKSRKDWSQCLREAQAADPDCRGDYPSADIPFVVLKAIPTKKGDGNLIEVGERLGLTLSITNFKDFAAFIKPYSDLAAAGTIPADLLLQGKLVHAQKSNAANKWGAATFIGFEPVEQSALAA